jgi:hypothetical protein
MTKKKKPSVFVKTKGLLEKNKRLSVVIAILLVVAMAMVARATWINVERSNFEKARVVLDDIYTDMVTQYGKPDNYESTRYCRYTSLKFQKGQLYCVVGWHAFYKTENFGEARVLANRLQKVFESQAEISKTRAYQSGVKGDDNIGGNVFELAWRKDCGNYYAYKRPGPIAIDYPNNDIEDEHGLVIGTDCSGDASKEYYPIHK